jgi:hypothetical protein
MDSFHAYPDPSPATNPPICAKYATPPGSPITAKITCMINQKGINAMAGILTVVIKKANISVCTLARGNITRYAPMTPEIAPEAPTAGISPPPALTAYRLCVRAAANPHPIYIKRYLIRPNLSSRLSPNTNKNNIFPIMWKKPPCINMEVITEAILPLSTDSGTEP